MALTTQRKEYIYQYAKENLKRIPLDVPKSDYEEIKAHASSNRESVNGFIKRAIAETIARDGAEKPTDAPERSAAASSAASSNAVQAVSVPAIAIPFERLNQVKAHAEARREPVSGFLVRAIDEKTMERDRNAPAASQGDSEGGLNDND